jgi:hypothetical protein
MQSTASPAARFYIHGLALRLRCTVPLLYPGLATLLGEFEDDRDDSRAAGVEGCVRPYDQTEVLRKLPAAATRLSAPGDIMELYSCDDQFWLIDDRWGMAHINIVRATWQSWVLPQPSINAIQTAEMAVMWPLAQLLRPRGLCLIPAAAMARDGWGVLLVSPLNLEPDLCAMVRAGYRVVGQRWVALREHESRVALLHLPGQLERAITGPGTSPRQLSHVTGWVDLEAEYPGSTLMHAECDAVMIIERGRRPVTLVRPVTRTAALMALRRNWPIVELHPHRRHGQLLASVSRHCRVFELRLSRNPADILKLLDDARFERTPAAQVESSVISRARRVVA